MTELLHLLFSTACGQNPAHTWSPGGLALPLCQRCTGVYVGACVATLLHLAVWPQATYRWRCWHGAFLLTMLPFGFHWLPQGPIVRTLTGVLFGFGVTAFLRLTLSQPAWRTRLRRAARSAPPVPPEGGRTSGPAYVYGAGLLATLVLVPLLGATGNTRAANTLTFLSAAGALTLCGMVLANVILGVRGLTHRLVRRAPRAAR